MVKITVQPDSIEDAKLRELLLYIAKKSEGDRPFGAVKLNKLLFFADFLAYLWHGKAITGQVYQRRDQGPCPKHIVPVLKGLEASGEAEQSEGRFFGKVQKRTVAKRDANLSLFSPEEIALVDGLITDAWGKTAKEMSDASHLFIGWELAETGESIP